jgi:hypothetical protein
VIPPSTTIAARLRPARLVRRQVDRHVIWPGPFKTNDAGIGNGNTIAEGTAGPAPLSAVVHGTRGAKVVRADLA